MKRFTALGHLEHIGAEATRYAEVLPDHRHAASM